MKIRFYYHCFIDWSVFKESTPVIHFLTSSAVLWNHGVRHNKPSSIFFQKTSSEAQEEHSPIYYIKKLQSWHQFFVVVSLSHWCDNFMRDIYSGLWFKGRVHISSEKTWLLKENYSMTCYTSVNKKGELETVVKPNCNSQGPLIGTHFLS